MARTGTCAGAGSFCDSFVRSGQVSPARRPFLEILAGVALLAASAPAQFINRALWLGRETESIRRDYDQGEEYFIDRWSYVDVPPWWRRGDTLDPFGNRLFVASGSVSTDRLTVEAIGNVGIDLGSGFTGRLNYLQSEHQSTQFERVAFGIDTALSEATGLFLQLEGTANKSRSDASFGVELFRGERSAHRLMFTMVDFAWRKSDTFDYVRSPYGLLLAGFLGDPDGVELAYDIGVQLPFEEQAVGDRESFEMDRTIWSIDARVRLADRDRLVLGFDGELTGKSLRQVDPGAPAREDVDVDKQLLQAAWWRSGDDGHEYSFGASWLHLAEDDVQPNAPAGDLRVRRTEAMLFGRARLPLGKAWSIEPYVIGGQVWLEERRGDGPSDSARFDGFQGKWGVPFRYDFSDRATIRFDVSFQLDELGFGGGGVQFVARF